jgi:hypothetical protein
VASVKGEPKVSEKTDRRRREREVAKLCFSSLWKWEKKSGWSGRGIGPMHCHFGRYKYKVSIKKLWWQRPMWEWD